MDKDCTFLNSTLSRAVHIDDKVTARIAKDNVACGGQCGNVWDRSGIRLVTKLKVYKAVLLPSNMPVRPEQYTSAMPKN